MSKNRRRPAIKPNFATKLLLVVATVLALAGGGVAFLQFRGDRAPASPSPSSSLEEIDSKMRNSAAERKRAPEWTWATDGQVERIIEVFEKVPERKTEQRVALLSALASAIKPESSWPLGFDKIKLQIMIRFYSSLLRPAHPGPESVLALDALAATADRIPEQRSAVEAIILAFYSAETRPSVKGRCLGALARFKSKAALPLLAKAVHDKDGSLVRASIYALDSYAATTFEKAARQTMLSVARTTSREHALAAKLLARQGDRRIASQVPALLNRQTTPAEMEAGAYVIEQFKLREYRALLEERAREADSMLANRLRAVLTGL